MTNDLRDNLQIFVRRFGLLNASCCESCCGAGVSLVQSHILFEIRRLGSTSIQQVADELGIDITTFSRQIKGMQEKGWIDRRLSAKDRRVNLLTLTKAGEALMAQIDRYLEARIEGLLAFMTPFERQAVLGALGLLNEALAKEAALSAEEKVSCCK